MRRIVCKEESTLSAFSLFKIEAQETFDSLSLFTSFTDFFFFISYVITFIVKFFSVFLAFTLLLLLKVAKVVWLICLSSPLSFSKVPLLKTSADHTPQYLRRVSVESDHLRRTMYSPSPCLRLLRICPVQMCSSSLSTTLFVLPWKGNFLIQRQMTLLGMSSSFSRMRQEKNAPSEESPSRAMRWCRPLPSGAKVLKSTTMDELTCRSMAVTVPGQSFARVFSRSAMSCRDFMMLMEFLDLLFSMEMREGAARKGQFEAIGELKLYSIRFSIEYHPSQNGHFHPKLSSILNS